MKNFIHLNRKGGGGGGKGRGGGGGGGGAGGGKRSLGRGVSPRPSNSEPTHKNSSFLYPV